jgi:FKBP-type peptidyl-prolyl cis-trans isomerase
VLFASDTDSPYPIRVGGRDCYAGIEYGLLDMRIGGRRTVVVSPNLTYDERKTYSDLPANAMLMSELELVDLPEKWDAEMERRLTDCAAEKLDDQNGG